MKTKKPTKTESAVRRRVFSDGEVVREPLIEDHMEHLRETCRMFALPEYRWKAEQRLLVIARVLAVAEMKAHQKKHSELTKDQQIKALIDDPRFAALGKTAKEKAIGKEVGVSSRKVAKFFPKGLPGRPPKTD